MAELRTLKNGALYDMERHRIVANPGGGTSAITTDTASAMQARSVEKKRQVMAAAANMATEDAHLFELFGDYAHVAARAKALQQIATTPEAGRAAVEAHKALTHDTGMAEQQRQEAASLPALPDGADLVAIILRRRLQAGEVIDATYTDTDTGSTRRGTSGDVGV